MMSFRLAALTILSALAAHPAGADCAVPESDPQACLTGTVVSSDYRAALVMQAGSPDIERVRPGDMLLDWTVAEIGPGYVVLSRDTQRARLELAEAPSGSAIKRGPMLRARLAEDRGG